MRRIAVFTATRAEFGLLRGVMEGLAQADDIELRVLVSGSHLSDELGRTVDEITQAGIDIAEQIDIELTSDSPEGICHSMGVAVDRYGRAICSHRPDLLVVLGDRYETLCLVQAAQVCRVPVAHIHGGERTEGVIDEAFRHSITKMSQVHFAACEEYARRIRQLGEPPENVHVVGSLGVEAIRRMTPLPRADLCDWLGLAHNPLPWFLVTFHPVTLDKNSAANMRELLAALEGFDDHLAIFTYANADTDGRIINQLIDQYVSEHTGRALAFASMGAERYLSAMTYCHAVIGNSSSGIIEAPALNVPTVNIGDRQAGRLRTPSIMDCPPNRQAITEAISHALSPAMRSTLAAIEHPCDKPGSAQAIVQIVRTVELAGLLKKPFVDYPIDTLPPASP